MKVWVNADDFGFTKSCTDAIYECFLSNIITTTTMCSNGDYFEYAVSLVKNTKYKNCIGLHINLTEGIPLTDAIRKNKKICNDSGEFNGFANRYMHLSKKDKHDIQQEIDAQFKKFLNSGLNIHHVDSHHHIHNSFKILPLIIKVCRKYNITKIRIPRNIGNISLIKKMYKFWIIRILNKYSYTNYMGSLEDFDGLKKQKKGLVEVMVHPDFTIDKILIDRINCDYDNPIGNIINFNKREVVSLND